MIDSQVTAAIAEFRGDMQDGYTANDVFHVFRTLHDLTDVHLICVWDECDDDGPHGHSNFYVLVDGRAHELTGPLWQFLNGAPDDLDTPLDAGDPQTWTGPEADFELSDEPWDGYNHIKEHRR